jgi:hypothetical protein
MNKFKKVVSLTLCILIVGAVMTIPTHAFHGYSHWDIARRVAVNKGIPTTNNQRLIYQSGTLAADLGKAIGWDDNYTTSDSSTFSNKIVALASTANEKWFAAGWRDHVIQDTQGSIANIPSIHSNYTLKCGWLDEYLRDKRKITCPINGTANLFLSYGLIRNTYNSLDSFSPTDAQINSAISKMYNAYNTAILANVFGMDATEIAAMDAEFDRTASFCGGTNLMSIPNAYDMTKDELDIMIDRMNAEDKKEQVDIILKQIDEITELQVVGTYGEFTELKFVIEDQESYNGLLSDIYEIVSK